MLLKLAGHRVAQRCWCISSAAEGMSTCTPDRPHARQGCEAGLHIQLALRFVYPTCIKVHSGYLQLLTAGRSA